MFNNNFKNIILFFLFLLLIIFPIIFIYRFQNKNVIENLRNRVEKNKPIKIDIKNNGNKYSFKFMGDHTITRTKAKNVIDLEFKLSNSENNYDLEEIKPIHFLLKEDKNYFNIHITHQEEPFKIIEGNYKKTFFSKKNANGNINLFINNIEENNNIAEITDFDKINKTFKLTINQEYKKLIIPLIVSQIILLEIKNTENADYDFYFNNSNVKK